MKILRKEVFGGVLFDTSNLNYKLVGNDEAVAYDKLIPQTELPPRSDILSAPVRIYFELTKKCNLICKHCFVSASKLDTEHLNLTKVQNLLDHIKEFRVLDLRFTGGEPTQRQDWFEILSYAKELEFAISINTNGVYVNMPEMVKKFCSLGPNQITISLDGLENNHDKIRGKGTFKKTIQTLIALSTAQLPLRVNTVITKANYKDIPGLIDIVAKYIREINIFYARPIGRAADILKSSLTFEEHYQSALDVIALRDKYPQLNIMHFEQSLRERSISSEIASKFQLNPSLPYGNSVLAIAADGRIWPHGYSPYQLSELCLGKFPEKTVSEIWNHSHELEKFRLWTTQLASICSRCIEYQNRCAGINFEMVIAKQTQQITKNPFCIANENFPLFV